MKKTAFILAMLMLLGTVSCGSTEPVSTDTTAGSDTTTAAETEPTYTLPEGDFGGRDVNFFLVEDLCSLPADEENGDVINDAVYRRNCKVEELYNVNFKFTVVPGRAATWNQFQVPMEGSILADDGSIDIVGAYAYRLVGIYYDSDLFHNLLDVEQIDFSQPWWPGNYTEVATIGSRQFAAQGNIDPSFYDRTYLLAFNKKIAADAKIENLYDVVKSGKWTIDKMEEVAKNGTVDLNGDTKMDANDQYGYLSGKNLTVDPFNYSFGLSFVEYDNTGTPKLVGLTEKIADACTKIQEFVLGSGNVFYDLEANINIMFQQGKGLLAGICLLDSHTMRSMDIDFGFLPYPKWDENQENYLTYNAGTDAATAYAIPVTADAELGACLLEALAYYGYYDVWPEYFERALKGKNARDDESAEMLEMIFDNIYFDFTQIYSFAFGDRQSPSMLMRACIQNKKDVASQFAALENIHKETMEKLLSALK